MDAIMKNTKEKREAAFMKIAWDVLKMKQSQDIKKEMIVYDFLHLNVKDLQKRGLLFNIKIPELSDE